MQKCSPREETHIGAGEECEEEAAAETTCSELTAFPTPCTPAMEEVEGLGVKLSPGKREGWVYFLLS